MKAHKKAAVVTEKITRSDPPALGARAGSAKKSRVASAKGSFRPTAPTALPKKNTRQMHADRPPEYLHKGKKRPETAK